MDLPTTFDPIAYTGEVENVARAADWMVRHLSPMEIGARPYGIFGARLADTVAQNLGIARELAAEVLCLREIRQLHETFRSKPRVPRERVDRPASADRELDGCSQKESVAMLSLAVFVSLFFLYSLFDRRGQDRPLQPPREKAVEEEERDKHGKRYHRHRLLLTAATKFTIGTGRTVTTRSRHSRFRAECFMQLWKSLFGTIPRLPVRAQPRASAPRCLLTKTRRHECSRRAPKMP